MARNRLAGQPIASNVLGFILIVDRTIVYTVSTIVRWATELYSGLEYLEANKVVHHDIKPENILMGDRYLTKIADFGVMRKVDEPLSGIRGTPRYIAPEILQETEIPREHAFKCDVYSMGITLLEVQERGSRRFTKTKNTIRYDSESPAEKLSEIRRRSLASAFEERPSASEMRRLYEALKFRYDWLPIKAPSNMDLVKPIGLDGTASEALVVPASWPIPPAGTTGSSQETEVVREPRMRTNFPKLRRWIQAAQSHTDFDDIIATYFRKIRVWDEERTNSKIIYRQPFRIRGLERTKINELRRVQVQRLVEGLGPEGLPESNAYPGTALYRDCRIDDEVWDDAALEKRLRTGEASKISQTFASLYDEERNILGISASASMAGARGCPGSSKVPNRIGNPLSAPRCLTGLIEPFGMSTGRNSRFGPSDPHGLLHRFYWKPYPMLHEAVLRGVGEIHAWNSWAPPGSIYDFLYGTAFDNLLKLHTSIRDSCLHFAFIALLDPDSGCRGRLQDQIVLLKTARHNIEQLQLLFVDEPLLITCSLPENFHHWYSFGQMMIRTDCAVIRPDCPEKREDPFDYRRLDFETVRRAIVEKIRTLNNFMEWPTVEGFTNANFCCGIRYEHLIERLRDVPYQYIFDPNYPPLLECPQPECKKPFESSTGPRRIRLDEEYCIHITQANRNTRERDFVDSHSFYERGFRYLQNWKLADWMPSQTFLLRKLLDEAETWGDRMQTYAIYVVGDENEMGAFMVLTEHPEPCFSRAALVGKDFQKLRLHGGIWEARADACWDSTANQEVLMGCFFGVTMIDFDDLLPLLRLMMKRAEVLLEMFDVGPEPPEHLVATELDQEAQLEYELEIQTALDKFWSERLILSENYDEYIIAERNAREAADRLEQEHHPAQPFHLSRTALHLGDGFNRLQPHNLKNTE
ncbi:unnamed protein product, partial [Mesorhabditis spiculigera]